MQFVLPLNRLKNQTTLSVGGKASQLGKLLGSGVRTSPGFVVTTEAFNLFLESAKIRPEVIKILSSIDHSSSVSVGKSAQKIKQLILSKTIPQSIVTQVKESASRLPGNTFAVRSSGIVEDAQEASWAGEFDTFLHRSSKTIGKDIQRCWASRFNPRALVYQKEQKINPKNIGMAVIVQTMIPSEVAGVGFTLNPVTHDAEQLVIEAGLGLGESLVSGQITPDNYVVDKYSFEILDKTISHQAFLLKRGSVGVVKQTLTQKQGSKQKLSDQLIKELAKQMILVEKHFGHPCDIEWAVAKGKIYILQSRPITGIQKEVLEPPKHTYKQMWETAGFGAFGVSVAVVESLRFRKEFSSFSEKNWFLTSEKTQCAMYYSREEMKQAAKWGKKDFLNPAWCKEYFARSKKSYQSAGSFVKKHSFSTLQNFSRDELYTATQKAGDLLAELFAYFTMCQPQCTADLENTLQMELQGNISSLEIPKIVAELNRPTQMTTIEREQLDWLGLCSMNVTEKEAIPLLQKHADMYGIIGTAGSAKFDLEYYQKLFKKRNKQEAAQEFKKKKKYWLSVAAEKRRLARKLKISSQAVKIGNIIADVGYNRFELRLQGWMPLYFWFLSALFPTLEKRYGLPTHLSMQLTFVELLQFLTSKQVDLKELEQRSRFLFYRHDDGRTSIITGPAGRKLAEKNVPPLPKNVKELSGQVAQVGLVTGKAFILRWNSPNLNEDMDKMPKGSILVVGQTLPHLMPAIKKASAIVTDEGGMASHSAIVSRELGIPCIIGTGLATKLIKTGQKLRVNANEGVVEILSR
ncbi:MAG: Phosphoenolpyruvate synthase [Candidatus Pacebacteria bacterium GW2011_GWA1_46_10]|nr:MAG: Phosphoenolpyruvate synthase [Candidatus Pacebacteria bacterium GW2011_GWA1_46_10]HCR81603.1 hypothetical protein [Candidatus Paceibacterota bacterium]